MIRVINMIRGILLILAILFAVFMVSGIVYTKIFGPIGGEPAKAAPSAAIPSSQK